MRNALLLGVWGFMVLAALTEVEAFYTVASYYTLLATVSMLAASQAVAVVLFYMGLKDEPGAMRLFALVPILFLAGLFTAFVASLG